MLLRFLLCALILFLSVPSLCETAEVSPLERSSRECPTTTADGGACPATSRVDSPQQEQCRPTEDVSKCSEPTKDLKEKLQPSDKLDTGRDALNEEDRNQGLGEKNRELELTEETVTSELNGHQPAEIKGNATPPPGNGSSGDSTIQGTELPAQSQQNTMEVQPPTTTGEDEPKSNDTTPNTESVAQTTAQSQEDNGTQSSVADTAGTPASPSPEGNANTADDTTTQNEGSTTATTTLPPEPAISKKGDADSSSSIISSSVWVRVPLLIVVTLACILVC
ncbi:uncharacterized protein TM35_000771040 [Trypanosoma theileri]|uniref:Titin n=1 Tax=Trypanosoma theileri TaxID=67003 RepID=A0A1X0NEZ2_9TRYP|nr:uncharacterized protein TM35_000771040 [Trypanosoma theileri]ORC83142.1 hypothetical protein TM35_000771040 [Trypanosoma theileri]